MATIYTPADTNNTGGGPNHWTDYEAAVVYLALARRGFATHTSMFREELQKYPEIEFVFERHSFGSVSMKWTDFRTAVSPELTPTRGAKLPQIRRIVEDWRWLTDRPMRPDLVPVAA